MKKVGVLILLISILYSCKTTKTIPYISNPTFDSSHLFVFESYEVPIQVGDKLSIVISALNPASAQPYNFPSESRGVLVDQEGYVTFPQLGNIRVAGLTRPQLSDLLKVRLKTYVTDPIVIIDFLNFKITMLGEVGSQGTINVPDGKINILEALAQSGDITTYGKKNMVQIIRETNGKREFGWVNLYSPTLFTTPYYRLRQNDIIYVHPMETKPVPREDKFRNNLALVTSLFGVITTIALFVIQLSK
jgi:polysaccharide biosynthesis/export protein